MKKIVTLLLLSCITLISVAQVVVDPKGTKVSMDSSKWKISGNDIHTKNTGNVGIGTSNPAYKLDVSAAANPVRIMGVQNGSSTDSVITIVNGVIKKVAASSFNRNDSTTANNGLTLTGKNIQLGGSLTQSTTIATAGNALNITGLTAGASTDSLVTVNPTTGKISRINRSSLITATTNNLALSGNTLTSTVNGIAATSNAVSSVSNTSATNTLTTSVNGVAATGVNIINSNSLGISNGALTSTVNGVASSPVNVLTAANNGLTASNGTVQLGGTLTGATTIATSGNALNITGLTAGASTDSLVTVNTTTGKISRINPAQFINNDSTTASNGLNINGLDVKLGGNLTQATTITNNSNALTIATGGSAMNITGLTSGASTDSIVTINQTTGKLNMINRSSILAGNYINNSSTQQASSNFNISGNGTVGGNLSISGIPAGSMLYMNASGRISGVTNNLFYDTITKSMGIGNNAPVRALDVVQNNASSGIMKLQNTNANGYSSIDIWDNASTQVGNIGYANNGGSYGGSFYFATNTTKNMVLATNNTERIRISGTNGNIGIGVATPTAAVHLVAGTATANTAPLKFNSGTLLSTPESGAVEFDGTHYYGTISGTRYQLDQQSTGATTTASNGLNKSGNDIRLGGNLTAATTIGTTSTNTLNITGLQTGTASDSLVTILNGKISKISQAVIQDSTTAGNGLTLNGLNVQLGGTLSQPTTIATAGNALNITGLTAGASTDSIVTINTSTGKLNRINAASLGGVTSFSGGTTGLTPAAATTGAVTLAGTLDEAHGGTGLSTYTTGDLLYASNTNVLSKLSAVATGNALISGGTGTAPSWGKIGLSSHVSGTLPVANGGTGLSTIGTNGQVLTSNGSSLEWTTPSGGSTTALNFINLSSAFSISSTSESNITGWNFDVVAGKTYKVEVIGDFQTSNTNTGVELGFYLTNSGAGTIRGFAAGDVSSSVSSASLRKVISTIGAKDANNSFLLTTGVSATNTPHSINAVLTFTCTTSGTFNVGLASENNGTSVQLNANSTLLYQQLN
jgi:hypothetical protein